MSREIMQQAFDAMNDLEGYRPNIDKAMLALHQALAQPEQKPVAWYAKDNLEINDEVEVIWNSEMPKYAQVWIPLYTAPPRKEWVGLTNVEVQEIAKQLIDDAAYCSTHFAIAIEAELRRKNNAV